MKIPTQHPTKRCDCGQQALVTPMDSLYEFDYRCPCGRSGSISWNTRYPAPAFVPGLRQPTLELR